MFAQNYTDYCKKDTCGAWRATTISLPFIVIAVALLAVAVYAVIEHTIKKRHNKQDGKLAIDVNELFKLNKFYQYE